MRVDPDKLRQYRVSPDEVIAAVTAASTVHAIRQRSHRRPDTHLADQLGDRREVNDLLERARYAAAPGTPVSIRDVGVAAIGTDIATGYAHVNGRRTVYIQVTKRPDASTSSVVRARAARASRFAGGVSR